MPPMSSFKLFIFPILERICSEPALGQNLQKFCSRFVFSTYQQPLGVATWPIMCPLKCGILFSSHFPISPIRIFINVFNKRLLNTCYVAGPASTGLNDSWSRPQENQSSPSMGQRIATTQSDDKTASPGTRLFIYVKILLRILRWLEVVTAYFPMVFAAHSFHGMFWGLI